MSERKRVVVECRENGGRTTMFEDVAENFEAEYRIIRRADPPEPKVEVTAAEKDINQMNKPDLVKLGKELGLKVSNRMSIGKLKEAIEDANNSQDDNITEI